MYLIYCELKIDPSESSIIGVTESLELAKEFVLDEGDIANTDYLELTSSNPEDIMRTCDVMFPGYHVNMDEFLEENWLTYDNTYYMINYTFNDLGILEKEDIGIQSGFIDSISLSLNVVWETVVKIPANYHKKNSELLAFLSRELKRYDFVSDLDAKYNITTQLIQDIYKNTPIEITYYLDDDDE